MNFFYCFGVFKKEFIALLFPKPILLLFSKISLIHYSSTHHSIIFILFFSKLVIHHTYINIVICFLSNTWIFNLQFVNFFLLNAKKKKILKLFNYCVHIFTKIVSYYLIFKFMPLFYLFKYYNFFYTLNILFVPLPT